MFGFSYLVLCFDLLSFQSWGKLNCLILLQKFNEK